VTGTTLPAQTVNVHWFDRRAARRRLQSSPRSICKYRSRTQRPWPRAAPQKHFP